MKLQSIMPAKRVIADLGSKSRRPALIGVGSSSVGLAEAVKGFLGNRTLDEQRVIAGQINAAVSNMNKTPNINKPLVFSLIEKGKALFAQICFEGRKEVVTVEILQSNGKVHPHLQGSLKNVGKSLLDSVKLSRSVINQRRSQQSLLNLVGEAQSSITFDSSALQTFQLLDRGIMPSRKFSNVTSALKQLAQTVSAGESNGLNVKVTSQNGDIVALMTSGDSCTVASRQAPRGRGCFRPSRKREEEVVLTVPSMIFSNKLHSACRRLGLVRR